MTEIKRTGILGLGYYVPERVIDNNYFVDVLGLDRVAAVGVTVIKTGFQYLAIT